MKKHIILSLCSAVALAGGLVSCTSQQEDLFDESSANRLQHALVSYGETLSAAPNGWVMEYFTNNSEQGLIYLMKFDKDGSVTVGGRNKWIGGKYLSERSAYQFIADNGPVLSLSSFNTVFHVLCDPIDIPSTSENELGFGHRGDYEFVVMSADADNVLLKGKKYEQRIRLTPLAADADWETYFADLYAFSNSLFNSRFEPLILSVEGKRFGEVTNMSEGVMNIVADGDDALMETESANFIVRQGGIRFSKPYNGKNNAFVLDELVYDEALGMLRSADGSDGPAVTLSAGPLYDIYADLGRTWRISTTDIGGQFATLMADMAAKTKSVLNRNFQSLDITTSSSGLPEPVRAISFRMSGSAAASLVYSTGDVRNGDDAVRTTFSTTEGNNNGKRRLDDIVPFKAFIELLNATDFEMSSVNRMAPSTIRLQSKSNPDDYIVLNVV